jgi:hypothetical protein
MIMGGMGHRVDRNDLGPNIPARDVKQSLNQNTIEHNSSVAH